MNQITAKVICDSTNDYGNRITTFVVRFPRYILAELNTHRAISKNSASSRAKPHKVFMKSLSEDSFVPVQWMKEHKGMQGTEYFQDDETLIGNPWVVDKSGNPMENAKYYMNKVWSELRIASMRFADYLSTAGLTKQISNRLLEPFMMHEVVLTATEWENFFGLRCPQYEIPLESNSSARIILRSRKDCIKVNSDLVNLTDLQWRQINTGMADIHIMDLAEAMWDAYNESQPIQLSAGQWHLPYTDGIDLADLYRKLEGAGLIDSMVVNGGTSYDIMVPFLLKISAARCARISYKTFGEDSKIDYIADIELHDRLLISQPIHASPAEHQGKAMSNEEMDNNFLCEDGEVTLGVSRNFRGFKQYRTLLANETMR